MARYATFRDEACAVRRLAVLLALASLLAAQSGREAALAVTAVRHWVSPETTRIAVQVTGEFSSRSDRLHNPERVYFDILNARPDFDSKRIYSEPLDGPLAHRIRIAETQPGVTRVVIDLADSVEVASSSLSNPHRLIIELRKTAATEIAGTEKGAGSQRQTAVVAVAPPPLITKPTPALTVPTQARTERPTTAKNPADVQARSAPAPAEPAYAAPVSGAVSNPPSPTAKPTPALTVPTQARTERPTTAMNPADIQSRSAPAPAEPASATPVSRPPAPISDTPAPAPRPPAPLSEALTVASEIPAAAVRPTAPAKRTSAGESSLVRTLGLKIERVVIDAGHGGHDQGTEGPHGLLEKDLVLDVARRLGKLVEDRMGAEVIYTRSDDSFVPLGERTALANEKKADLFLSIHANSSSVPGVAGIETFYLNITGTKDAMNVAMRENAASDKSVYELADLVQKIAKQDKAEESREFAGRVQAALYAFSVKNVPGSKNRGVKSAPFVVLIGANMPSVLAEIGFLTNPREETLLKKPDYRQKLAEALYRGISRYAEGLSHFQTAAAAVPGRE